MGRVGSKDLKRNPIRFERKKLVTDPSEVGNENDWVRYSKTSGVVSSEKQVGPGRVGRFRAEFDQVRKEKIGDRPE